MRAFIYMLLMAAPVYAGANYNAAVIADTPISWWKMNEPSGTTMADSSGNSHTGGFNGGVVLGNPGIFGAGCSDTSALFDGSTQDAEASNIAAYHIATTGQLTVEAWAKMVGSPPVTNVALVFKGGVEPPNHFEWALEPHNLFADWDWAPLQDNGAVHADVLSTTAPSTSAFQHIVGTIIDSTNVKIYVNGVLEGTSTSFTGTAGSSSLPLFIAQFEDCSGSPCVFRRLHTYAAHVAIYAQALTLARVQAHYNAALADIAACAATPIRRRVYQMQ